MPVYIKKYTGNNYFSNRTFVDSIVFDKIPANAFPKFRFETEDYATIGTYRGGDFDFTVGLLDSTLSRNGDSIKQFFLGTERNFFYLVIVKVGSQTYAGVAQQSQISGDFTYNKRPMEINMVCKDMLIEWSKRCSSVANSTISFANGDIKTFEEYMYLHFAGITNDIVILNLPATTYLSHLTPYGNPAGCWAYGDFYNFITGQQNISRWETFKELAKGIGFNFEMYLNPGTEVLSNPEFIFNIFFIDDISNETPMRLKVLEHGEFTTESRLEYLYLKYRYTGFSEANYTDGIFFNSLEQYATDTDHGNGTVLHPQLQLTLNDKILSLTDANGFALKTVLRDVDFKELELKQYAYAFGVNIGIGKLYPPDEQGVVSSGLSYARIFNAATGSGTAIDRYDFKPVQSYTIQNYKRYLKGLQKAKRLKVRFDETTNIKNWKPIVVNDGAGEETYYISATRYIDTDKNEAEIEALLLN